MRDEMELSKEELLEEIAPDAIAFLTDCRHYIAAAEGRNRLTIGPATFAWAMRHAVKVVSYQIFEIERLRAQIAELTREDDVPLDLPEESPGEANQS